MANTKAKIKSGMAGSNKGKSRWERTEVLKEQSKVRRRRQAKQEIKISIEDNFNGQTN